MAQQPALMLFREKAAMFCLLTDVQAGRVIKAAIGYFDSGVLPEELEQAESLVFESLRFDIDRNAEKYRAICERNRTNGKNGGRPPSIPREADVEESPSFGQKPESSFEDKRRNAINMLRGDSNPSKPRETQWV